VALALLGGLSACGGSAKPPPVAVDTPTPSPQSGIQDDRVYQPGVDPSARTERVRKIAEGGATLLRVDLVWSIVAPTPPADPTDPADPAYQWASYDQLIAVAKANHLEVLFTVYGTPAWAADPAFARFVGATDRIVRPRDAEEFGAFATAAAKRFAPRGVHKWEGWNEPNIKLFFYPQYERQGDRWVQSAPQRYSALLKSFYAAVKSVDPNAVIAGGVFAPTGDKCGASCPVKATDTGPPNRMRAGDFLTALDQPGLRPPMDAVSHHPYPVSGPRPATVVRRNTIDIYNLDTLSAAIDRTYLRGKKIWLSEYGFGTAAVPNNPVHFSLDEQAVHIADAFQRFRDNKRVTLAVYYFLQDHPNWRSGLLEQDGTPKPGFAAYAFPFAVDQVSGPAVRLVGQARPANGRTKVQIEWKDGDNWRALTSAATAADGTFALTVRPTRQMALRATWTGETRSGQPATWTSRQVDVAVPARS
jgi:Cellulase (glycosyl hydrolase family 5)